MATAGTSYEGWGIIQPGERRDHYYRDRRSLCRDTGPYYGQLYAESLLPTTGCEQCRKILFAESGVLFPLAAIELSEVQARALEIISHRAPSSKDRTGIRHKTLIFLAERGLADVTWTRSDGRAAVHSGTAWTAQATALGQEWLTHNAAITQKH